MEEPLKKKVNEQTVISIQYRGSHDEIGGVYRKLYEWAHRHKIAVKGKGFTSFVSPANEFNPRSALFEVCLPVDLPVEGDAHVTVKTAPACTVACVTVTGPYQEIPARYTEMLAWLDAMGWETSGHPREVYIKRPDTSGQGDPGQFVTEIQFPISQE